MTKYIVFSDDEIEKLQNGEEIIGTFEEYGQIHFMRAQSFKEMVRIKEAYDG